MKLPTKKAASGFEMPVIGFGTWRMGGALARDPNNDDQADIAAIRSAIDNGINHIDTAEIYAAGYCEALVGEAIKNYPRTAYTLATKAKHTHLAYDSLVAACRASLARLKLEYVDVYYLHRPSDDVPLAETAKALRFLRDEGFIRHYGVCNFKKETQERLQELLDRPITVSQAHYSLIFREPEVTGLIDYCRKSGTLFTAWRPLLWRNDTRPNQPPASAWQKGIYPILDQLAKSQNKTTAQIAMSWLISQPNVTALFKSTKVKNIEEILGAAFVLDTENIERLRKEFPEQRTVSDTVPLA